MSIVDRYFSLNRTLLLVVGLWPYQKSKLARLYLFCSLSIVVTFVICQFTTFVTSKCTTDHIIKMFSTLFATFTLVIKYNSFYVNNDTIKYIMEQLQCTHDDLKDNNETAIIERYADNAKRITSLFTIMLLSFIFVIIGAQLWPDFIDIILSANESRSHRLQITTEYFIDEEKYYYVLLFHINLAICLGLTALIATGAMLIAYLQHFCGMFKIASYRIKNAIETYILSINLKKKNLVYKDFNYGIDIHRNAIMFSDYLISKFEMSFMFLIVFGVITLSLNTFRILSSTYSIEELPVTFVAISLSLIYMFISNFIGQEIIDHYDLIFSTAYEVQWYITPIYIQKLILFLLLRGNKSFGLNVGGLFIASFQCFATLANASLSYFVVMCSMR